MSIPPWSGGVDPESLGDAPLFRELQRVMAGGGDGPVNWELARQVGVATAAEAGPDAAATDDDREGIEAAVRLAELQVSATTGLESPARLATVRAVRRAEWVADQIGALRGLVEPAATRMGEALSRAMTEQLPDGAPAGIGGILSQVGPLLQGSQAGQVLGDLATRAFAGHDVAVPRTEEDDLVFVIANLAAFERDWSLDAAELRTAVALREVVFRATFSRPWVRPHAIALVDDFLATMRIDVAGLMEKFSTVDPSDPEAFQRALGGGEDDPLFGTVLDDEQRLKLARIQAFVGAAEGYASHVVATVGERMLGSWSRLAEALRRYRETEASDPVFARLLGIPVERAVLVTGRGFCDAVVTSTDDGVLARMWDGADAMPSLPELEEPTLWLSRTV